MNKIKTWFMENKKSFIISLIILIAIITCIILFPTWIIVIGILSYLSVLGFKIWKNKPF